MSGSWEIVLSLAPSADRGDAERCFGLLVLDERVPDGARLSLREVASPRDPALTAALDAVDALSGAGPRVEPAELEVAVDVRVVVARTDAFGADDDVWEQALASMLAGLVGVVVPPPPGQVAAETLPGGWLSISAGPAGRPLGIVVGLDPWRAVEGPRG